MLTRTVVTAASLTLILVACEDEPEAPVPAAEPAMAAPEPAPEADPPEVAQPTAAPSGELPRAEDVLPSGEVSAGSLVVAAEGFRFQIPGEGFSAAQIEGAAAAYEGDIAGMIGPAHLTIWVTQSAFEGDDAALEARERAAATEAGGTLRDSPPGMIHVAGASVTKPRFRVGGEGYEELRAVATHEGQGYVFHCKVTAESMPWTNAGSDCMIRATTFHIAPPQ